MFQAIAFVFGYLLKFWLDIVGNYGWAVVLFSITIKAILFPLTLKQQKSTRKTQELQPKLQALQEKYKDDQQKMSIEYQKFMKENKYNPFGGCLLMIFQLFVLIGVLYCVTNPMKYMEKMPADQIDVELKNAIIAQEYSGDSSKFDTVVTKTISEKANDDTFKKATKDLDASATDEEKYIAYYKATNRYYEIKILKNLPEYDLNFFGINLGDITMQNPSDIKLWIFPVLTTLFYYLSLWMMSKIQKKTTQKMKDANGNEVEMPNMMMMNITMPLLSGWISASVPQGMGLYWFMNSFLQVIIQLVTEVFIKKDKQKNQDSTEVIIEAENLEKTEVIEEVKEEKNNNEEPIKTGKNKNSSKKKHKKK